jgi:hypothetical protein
VELEGDHPRTCGEQLPGNGAVAGPEVEDQIAGLDTSALD